jgi:hypothetical protein
LTSDNASGGPDIEEVMIARMTVVAIAAVIARVIEVSTGTRQATSRKGEGP